MPTVTEPDRVGVHDVATLIHKERGWIFRKQHESDHGIDALVETVVAGQPTGRLIALQIKSVPSWFKMAPGTSASSPLTLPVLDQLTIIVSSAGYGRRMAPNRVRLTCSEAGHVGIHESSTLVLPSLRRLAGCSRTRSARGRAVDHYIGSQARHQVPGHRFCPRRRSGFRLRSWSVRSKRVLLRNRQHELRSWRSAPRLDRSAPISRAAARTSSRLPSALRVARLMRQSGLQGRAAKRWKKTTVSDPAAAARADRIRRDFTADASKLNTRSPFRRQSGQLYPC